MSLWLITFVDLFAPGLCFLRSPPAHQQTHPGVVHGQPRPVHAPPQTRHHRGAADEGPGQRGEEQEANGEVQKGRNNALKENSLHCVPSTLRRKREEKNCQNKVFCYFIRCVFMHNSPCQGSARE